MEYKEVKLEYKEIGDNYVEGYAAVFNNRDEGGDIITNGAFKRSIDHHKGLFPAFDKHFGEEVGMSKIDEEDKGLHFITNLYLSDDPKLDSRIARETYIKLKNRQNFGRPMGVSIEYKTLKDQWNENSRYIKEGKLYGFAFVPYPMNEKALVLDVKGATSFSDLPIDETSSWDADKAIKNVRVWAGGPDKDEIDWNKYRKAFFWYDSDNPEDYGSYKLPFADVKNGTLTAIAKGIFSAAGVINGAMGGVDIPESDVAKVKSHIEKYYAKLERESPFKSEKNDLDSFISELKEGRVLSSGNVEKLNNILNKLKNASSEINKLNEEINALLSLATPKPNSTLASTMSSSEILLTKSEEFVNFIKTMKERYQ